MSTNTKAEELIAQYKESLTEQEQLVLNIAIEHLESSFDIEKSIGYLKWLEDYKSEQEEKK
ncbi:MAG: hypothetical protein CMD14_02860 [Flavobacteriales bacterium]|nr:hypothetical protein [Flavobacteriales bacterium]|tara:strand:- start:7675 stop:7857 length:183 start_codon:yes stop_codon:yes gene_type:complete